MIGLTCYPNTLIVSTSPKETPNTHYMMLYWGLFPRLTTKVVPEGLNTINTSRKEANTPPMGVQQHTMIIYIRIYSEVTNTSTVPTPWEGIYRMQVLSPLLLVHQSRVIVSQYSLFGIGT